MPGSLRAASTIAVSTASISSALPSLQANEPIIETLLTGLASSAAGAARSPPMLPASRPAQLGAPTGNPLARRGTRVSFLAGPR